MDAHIQTTVFRDGQWVTETVNVHAALKSMAKQPAPKLVSQRPPSCGLLTRTVAESQLAHFILPVRLRSSHQRDVAFVGVSALSGGL